MLLSVVFRCATLVQLPRLPDPANSSLRVIRHGVCCAPGLKPTNVIHGEHCILLLFHFAAALNSPPLSQYCPEKYNSDRWRGVLEKIKSGDSTTLSISSSPLLCDAKLQDDALAGLLNLIHPIGQELLLNPSTQRGKRLSNLKCPTIVLYSKCSRMMRLHRCDGSL